MTGSISVITGTIEALGVGDGAIGAGITRRGGAAEPRAAARGRELLAVRAARGRR